MGLMLDMEMSGGVFGGTAAGASPQGPTTAAAAGFGTTAANAGGGFGSDVTTNAILGVGTVALIGLAYIWWSLPR